MRHPRPSLTFVDTESLQPQHEIARELVGPAGVRIAWNELLAEDEHRDPRRLAVCPNPKERDSSGSRGAADGICDRIHLRSRTASEERDRDVKVIPLKDADAFVDERLLLPGDERRNDLVG